MVAKDTESAHVCVCLAQLAVTRMRECEMESALESDLEFLVFTHPAQAGTLTHTVV